MSKFVYSHTISRPIFYFHRLDKPALNVIMNLKTFKVKNMNLKETLQRMRDGRVYYCNSEELMQKQLERMEIIYDYNASRPLEQAKRAALLKEIFAEIGENGYVEPPLRANWGFNTHIGKNFYANFNLTLVDDTDIFIGDNVLIGPNVVLATANHPVRPDIRSKAAQYNLPVRIGNNVWLGADVVVVPGVSIGDNTVIGAGSVVTKDIPADCVAFGNPCHVQRKISERDMLYYHKDRKIDMENL